MNPLNPTDPARMLDGLLSQNWDNPNQPAPRDPEMERVDDLTKKGDIDGLREWAKKATPFMAFRAFTRATVHGREDMADVIRDVMVSRGDIKQGFTTLPTLGFRP